MGISLNYTPFGAVADLAATAGLGQYRQRQDELAMRQQQLALQQQAQQQDAFQQQQRLAAQLASQQMQNQQQNWSQMQHQNWQAQRMAWESAQDAARQQAGYKHQDAYQAKAFENEQAMLGARQNMLFDNAVAEAEGGVEAIRNSLTSDVVHPDDMAKYSQLMGALDRIKEDKYLKSRPMARASALQQWQRNFASAGIRQKQEFNPTESWEKNLIRKRNDDGTYGDPVTTPDGGFLQWNPKTGMAEEVGGGRSSQPVITDPKQYLSLPDKRMDAYSKAMEVEMKIAEKAAKITYDNDSNEIKTITPPTEEQILARMHAMLGIQPGQAQPAPQQAGQQPPGFSGQGQPQFMRAEDGRLITPSADGRNWRDATPDEIAAIESSIGSGVNQAPDGAAGEQHRRFEKALKILDPQSYAAFQQAPPDKRREMIKAAGGQINEKYAQLSALTAQSKPKAILAMETLRQKHGGTPPEGSPDRREWDWAQKVIDLAKEVGVN